MANTGINPSRELAYCESVAEDKNSFMTDLENVMGQLVGSDQDNPAVQAQTAEMRTLISQTRAQIGFWRGEASFWKNEIQENKTALKESNNLSKSS